MRYSNWSSRRLRVYLLSHIVIQIMCDIMIYSYLMAIIAIIIIMNK